MRNLTNREAVLVTLGMLVDSRPSTRWFAANTLGDLGALMSADMREHVITILRVVARVEPDHQIRQRVQCSIDEIRDPDLRPVYAIYPVIGF